MIPIMKKISIIIFLCIQGWMLWAQQKTIINTGTQIELPCYEKDEPVIRHRGYTLHYSETYEQASWVAYVLTREETNNIFKRSNKFETDPAVITGSASDEDYRGSGYDRGHLAPAADMGWSAITMQESFFYSNMSPQVPSFNRGIWKELEELLRSWAQAYDSICVVTGPVLKKGLPTIGPNQVAIPELYYKVILDNRPEHMKAIGFILRNTGSEAPLDQFAVTVDSVERMTGIDFFCKLGTAQQMKLESHLNTHDWIWETKHPSFTSSKSKITNTEDHEESKSGTPALSLQCIGITKKGARCKNKAKSVGGKCHVHD
jgi:endonuclease G